MDIIESRGHKWEANINNRHIHCRIYKTIRYREVEAIIIASHESIDNEDFFLFLHYHEGNVLITVCNTFEQALNFYLDYKPKHLFWWLDHFDEGMGAEYPDFLRL